MNADEATLLALAIDKIEAAARVALNLATQMRNGADLAGDPALNDRLAAARADLADAIAKYEGLSS
jgi:hypothetical protein